MLDSMSFSILVLHTQSAPSTAPVPPSDSAREMDLLGSSVAVKPL